MNLLLYGFSTYLCCFGDLIPTMTGSPMAGVFGGLLFGRFVSFIWEVVRSLCFTMICTFLFQNHPT